MSKGRALADAFRFAQGNNLIFAVTDLLGNIARGLVLPYMSLYILALGGDTTRVGLVNSMAPLAGLFMFPLGGYLADHTSRVKLVALGSGYSAAIVLLFILAPSWEAIAVAALLQGLAVFPFPARSALIAHSLPPGDRVRGIAVQNAISWGMAVFAPYIGGVVIDAHGPKAGLRGLYGVMIGRAFFGESMFSRVSNSSKVAFVRLVENLRRLDVDLIDCQVKTDHLMRFGAREIPRKLFLEQLKKAVEAKSAGKIMPLASNK